MLGEFSENQTMDHIYFYLLPWLLHSTFRVHTEAETEFELSLDQELTKSQQGFEINCAIALEEQPSCLVPCTLAGRYFGVTSLEKGLGRKTMLTVAA